MITDPNYQSDEEILKRLQQHLNETSSKGTRPSRIARLDQDTHDLMLVLAERIYAEPERWGLRNIPQPWRDDVANDSLLGLLQQASSFGGRELVADWFAKDAERRFRGLWSKTENVADTPREMASPSFADQEATAEEQPEVATSALLDAADGPWQRFEQEFPRDAFALRLRYVLKRTPDEMLIMLDAPTVSAIHSRLSRARGRMRMFFDQSRFDRSAIQAILKQFGDEQVQEEGL